MLIKGFRDLTGMLEERIDRSVPKWVVDSVYNKIYYDKNRPSFGENWRQYVDCKLPSDLTLLIDR